MNLLIDTHTFLWWLGDDPRLSSSARSQIEEGSNPLWFSAASGWEIAIKVALGKLSLPGEAADVIPRQLDASAITILPVSLEHALHTASLPHHHSDPFDRLLVAQAQIERLTVLTSDPAFGNYDIDVVW